MARRGGSRIDLLWRVGHPSSGTLAARASHQEGATLGPHSIHGTGSVTWTYVLYSYALLPLVALTYLVLASWVLRRISKASVSAWTRLLLSLVFVVVFLVIPFGDDAIGRHRFAQLCDSQAAMKIYRVALLEPKYLRADGWPTPEELLPDRTEILIARRYAQRGSREEVFAWPKIARVRTEMRDELTGDVLGEIVDFGYSGGWLVQQLPGHPYGKNCPEIREKRTSLQKAVFRPASARKKSREE